MKQFCVSTLLNKPLAGKILTGLGAGVEVKDRPDGIAVTVPQQILSVELGTLAGVPRVFLCLEKGHNIPLYNNESIYVEDLTK